MLTKRQFETYTKRLNSAVGFHTMCWDNPESAKTCNLMEELQEIVDDMKRDGIWEDKS